MLHPPGALRQIKLQIAAFHGPVISFADITENQDAGRSRRCISRLGAQAHVRSNNGEANRVPKALGGRPGTTAGIP